MTLRVCDPRTAPPHPQPCVTCRLLFFPSPQTLQGDLRCFEDIDSALAAEPFDAFIHFAGRKAVGESVAEPMLYYTHNVAGTVNLIEAMRKHNVKKVK